MEKPTPPGPMECCEGNCDPCVWDHYYTALAMWKEEQKALKAASKQAKKDSKASS